jgi:DNA-binding NarL/FixJ family response regulator
VSQNQSQSAKHTILIVDDHSLLSSGLCLLLNAERDLEVVGQAADLEAAMREAERLQPEIILLDISLPQGNSLDFLPSFRQGAPGAKIIMLTMHEESGYLQKALSQGAVGYVLKRALDQDLLYAIRSVLRGEIYVQPAMVKHLMATESTHGAEQSPTARAAKAGQQLWSSLSEREREVITGVALGFTSKELGEKYFISEKTIATYRSRAMTKLGLSSKSELVELVMRLGIPHQPL